MDRREFFLRSTAGVASVACGVSGAAPAAGAEVLKSDRLFPLSLPAGEWVRFRAAGFTQPACGVIYRRENQVLHGMPLGGISTGYLDVETNGIFRFSSLFNSGVPLVGGPWPWVSHSPMA